MAARVDIAIVSLGTTMGWRRADEALAVHVEAVGATCELRPIRIGGLARQAQRTMATTDLVQALAARRAAAGVDARAVVYSSITAALLQPPRRPHAIRFDTIAALSRPGAGGAWQRWRERAVLARADLLLPWSEAAADAARRAVGDGPATVVLPCVVDAPAGEDAANVGDGRAVVTAYAANPDKRGLDVLCAAWAEAAPEGVRLVVGGIEPDDALRWLARAGVAAPPGVEFAGPLPRERWTALVAGSRAYVSSARYEDWGIAQMEALAAGVPLVTVPTPGPNAALPLARRLAPELVAADATPAALAAALRAGLALDGGARAAYAAAARAALDPYSDAALRSVVAERVLPALLG